MELNLLIKIYILILVFYSCRTSKTFESIPKQAVCKSFDPELVENLTCIYKQLSWKKAKFSGDGYLKPGVILDNLAFKGIMYRRGTNMEYRVFLTELNVDLCRFLNGTWSHIIVDLVSAYIKKVSKENNIFHPCPFSGHLYVHDIIFDENSYSVVNFLPTGFYMYISRIITQYKNKEHLLVETITRTEIKPLGLQFD